MSDDRRYLGGTSLRSLPSAPHHSSAEPYVLRTRAARYRRLAETLLDPRVVAVVQACAQDLEMQATLTDTSGNA